MGNVLLGGIAIASAFALMIPSLPAAAQGGCGNGHPCSGARAAGVGARAAGAGPMQSRYQHQGYAHNYGRGGYGVGVEAAAVAAGVILGGAMQPNPGYYPDGYYPDDSYPVYSDPVYSDQVAPYDDAGPQLVNDGDSTAYCQQTYRSYDPVSGSYLGYDGLRHPCP